MAPTTRSGPLGVVLRALVDALAVVVVAALVAAPSAAFQSYTDAELERAWAGLSVGERKELAEWFQLELTGIDTLERRLVFFIARRADVDPGFWPAAGTAAYFEPGGNRKRLPADSDEARAMRERVASRLQAPATPWTYDFATRRLVRHADDRAPEYVFREALRGRSPELDYTLALVQRMLDDGRYQSSFAALAHAYSEDDGDVHPDLTLYEVLASEEPLPLSDVDSRSVVRWLTGDAFPEGEDRQQLDRRVLEIFDAAHAWRGWLELLARAYVTADPALAFGVQEALQLHALWQRAESDPAELVALLPGPDTGPDALATFLDEWATTFRVEKLRTDAIFRKRDLENGPRPVRLVLEYVFRESGALEPRDATAAPAPAAESPAAPSPVLGPEARAALVERVARMSRSKRRALVERCTEAAWSSGAVQVALVRLWTGRADVGASDLPPPTVFEAHDAGVYKGGPPRRPIGPGQARWDALERKIVRESEPARVRAVDYELSTGRLVAPHSPEPSRARGRSGSSASRTDELDELRLLLDGVLPGQDLAAALVLRALDEPGAVRREAEYFAHLYSDRDGYAYEGITLRDVWSSEASLEVPDVDALAYIRKLWNDTTVKPPLSTTDHGRWYPRISASLARLREHENVARALARVWFEGRPELSFGYDASIDVLHALVARHGENAGALARRLEADGREFLRRGLGEIAGLGNDGWNAGNARRDALIDGRDRIRAAVAAVLMAEGSDD
jgi:hypothetical protein